MNTTRDGEINVSANVSACREQPIEPQVITEARSERLRANDKKTTRNRRKAQIASDNGVHQDNNPDESIINRQNESFNNRRKDKKTVVVLGDSIVKYVQGRKLSTKVRTVVKSFLGAKVDHMFHYVKPTLERQPDEVILHVGTNDLKDSTAKHLAERIIDLGHHIVARSPSTKVTISSLTCRNDNKLLNKKVNEVNNRLRTLTLQPGQNWKILWHYNITAIHLNARGLHLNHEGTDILSSNFSKYINNP